MLGRDNPTVAADLANEIALVYKMYDEKAKAAELDDTQSTLIDELADTKTALDEVNRKIFELRERAPMAGADVDLPRLQLQQLTDRAPPLAAEIRDQEIALETITKKSDLEGKIGTEALASLQTIQGTAKLYRSALSKVELLKDDGVGSSHPDLIAGKAAARDARSDLQAAVNAAVSGMETKPQER